MSAYLDYDGQPTPIEALLWVGVSPCGCYNSSLTADSGPYMTAEAAKMEQAGGSRVVAERDPDTYILVKRGDPDFVAKFTTRCPHTPAYGRDDVDLPDGLEWGYAGSSRVAHALHVGDDKWKVLTDPLCGWSSRTGRRTHWTTAEWFRRTVQCRKCQKVVRESEADS